MDKSIDDNCSAEEGSEVAQDEFVNMEQIFEEKDKGDSELISITSNSSVTTVSEEVVVSLAVSEDEDCAVATLDKSHDNSSVGPSTFERSDGSLACFGENC